jgi:acetyl-CoA acetyltransferase
VTRVHQGAIALKHPPGARGARLMTTVVDHMRCTGSSYGLRVGCERGDMANTTLIELLWTMASSELSGKSGGQR